jgi:Family of unknown function (DUF5995)
MAPPNAPSDGIDAVVDRLRAIQAGGDGVSPHVDGDEARNGLKSFNSLYLEVTEAVRDRCREAGFFERPEWISRLDVVFAEFYFRAVDAAADGGRPPTEWRPLFTERADHDQVHPLQFAFTGMNAHINHDLSFAIIRTCQELGFAPEEHAPPHNDFTKVNDILGSVEQKLKARYEVGELARLDRRLGRADDLFVMWNIQKAREAAWEWAQLLWPMRDDPDRFARANKLIGGLVGVVGRGLTLLSVPKGHAADG